ncbi:Hint domain-containing protein [Poseidonocella sp. HB161398]|uniref:Hint domain-containing protein n=1 Tax=Poseidonocella sp. HB161398 TaxID=2320855 RepID=UPI0011092640|nr:Hint domain-containing protein [Poseidonocella sp. HB161398]
MSTTFSVIYIGTYGSIDQTEGDALADHASLLSGTTAGSADQPLWKSIQTLSPGSTGYSAGVWDSYDQSNSPSESFRINDGADQTFDAGALYNGTVHFADGTSATTTLILFQDTSGRTYLAPEYYAGSYNDLMSSAPIESIEIGSVAGDSWSGLDASRAASVFVHPATVDGTAGSDSMGAGYADAQGDQIEPNAGAADSVSAGAGNDTVDTGAGNDTVSGGDGNDVIYAGKGNDSLAGDAGNDRFIYLSGDGADTILGGSGTDTLDFSGLSGPVAVSYSGAAAGTFTDTTWQTSTFSGIEHLTLSDYADTVDAGFSSGSTYIDGGAGDDYIEYGTGSSTVFGGEGDDFIDDNVGTQEAGSDYLDGGAGNDRIYAGSGTDTVFGGSGSDTITGEGGDDLIHGGEGADSITGDADADTIYGDAGDDTIEGGSGADSLMGGAGRDAIWGGTDGSADTIQGGDDQDTIHLSDGFGAASLSGGEGGTDQDLLDITGHTGPVTLTFTGEGAGMLTDGTATATFSEFEAFALGAGSDSVDASASTGAVTVSGGAGSDTITGTSAADSIAGGTGADHLYGGAGADTISGGDGDDLIVAGSGADSITGGEGADTLLAEFGDDTVEGGGGGDVIGGSLGADLLSGGAGNDTFLMTYADSRDTITDFDLGDSDGDGLSNDQLDVSDLTGGRGAGGAITAWDVTVGDDGAGNAVLTFPGAESVVLMGISPDSLSSPAQIRTLGIPCFTPGTRIATAKGPVPVEALRPGDLVETADAGLQPLIWRGESRLDAAALAARPEARPVRILPGGPVPVERPLLVSPQHCMVIRHRGAELFLRARHLARIPGARAAIDDSLSEVTYLHLLLPSHQVIFAEGAPSESLWPGPMAVAMLPAPERRALARHLPWIGALAGLPAGPGRDLVGRLYGPPARPEAGRQARRQIARALARSQPPISSGTSARSAKLAAAGNP